MTKCDFKSLSKDSKDPLIFKGSIDLRISEKKEYCK